MFSFSFHSVHHPSRASRSFCITAESFRDKIVFTKFASSANRYRLAKLMVSGRSLIYKNKNILEKMIPYVGFRCHDTACNDHTHPTPTYILHTLPLLDIVCGVGMNCK